MKVMIVKELMTGDVSPVAMFFVYAIANAFVLQTFSNYQMYKCKQTMSSSKGESAIISLRALFQLAKVQCSDFNSMQPNRNISLRALLCKCAQQCTVKYKLIKYSTTK